MWKQMFYFYCPHHYPILITVSVRIENIDENIILMFWKRRPLTSSVSFTLRICSRRSCRSLNVDCAVMEYTKAKPWPFFMYRSLIAVNCSYRARTEERTRQLHVAFILYDVFFQKLRLMWLTVPAVSRISSMHCCPSTSTCCWTKKTGIVLDRQVEGFLQ